MIGRRLILAGLPLALASCGSILPQPGPPPLLYRLTPLPPAAPSGAPLPVQLVVAPPLAPASLDTARVALTRGANGFDYFASAAWADPAPAMLESLLVESLENAGRFRVVASQSGELRADAALASSLRRFEAAYDGAGPPRIAVALDCRLLRPSDLTVVAVRSFAAEAPAQANDMPQIVAAFDAALHAALADLPGWVERSLAGARS